MTTLGLYILDESGEKPVSCPDIDRWAEWYMDFAHRRVARTFLETDMFVSTVFLAVNNSLSGIPLLWETMIFAMGDNGEMRQLDCAHCAGNREQALAMHEEMCERVRAVLALEFEAV